MNRGSVYKRKDGRWEFRIYLGKNGNGRRIFRSFYGKTKEEVEFKATIFSETYNYNVTNLTVKDKLPHESRKTHHSGVRGQAVLFNKIKRHIHIHRK